eukprot:1041515-Rhodomonas_salina.1
MMSGTLSLSASLRVCHPEGLADLCPLLDALGACNHLTMCQFCLRRGRHVHLAQSRSTFFQSHLLQNSLVDICGKIAFASREAELDPVDVMF